MKTTKEEIYQKYKDLFNLDNVDWMLLPAISVKNDNSLSISGITEIDKDVLFFEREEIIYVIKNIQLDEQLGKLNYLQKALKEVIKNKQTIAITQFPESSIVFEYVPKGNKGQVKFWPDQLTNIVKKVEDYNLNIPNLVEKDTWVKKLLKKVEVIKSTVHYPVFVGQAKNGKELDKILTDVKNELTEENFTELFSQLYILGEDKKWI